MKDFNSLSKNELIDIREKLESKYNKYLLKKLNVNMIDGNPCKEQLDLALPMLENKEYLSENNTDLRNYGILDGIDEAKKLFSEILNIDKNNIIIGGNSTLNMIYDCFVRLYIFGYKNHTPWGKLKKVKILCPVPGYSKHFNIIEHFGFEMININITKDGIDMDTVERLCIEDESIKGIICVPLHSNPTGTCYSKETVERLAKMQTKAKDFKIFWDNAYAIHHIYEKVELYNIFDACKKYYTEDRIMYFFSTSKITFAGGGICIFAGSENTIEDTLSHLSKQTIGYDKINQLRTVRFLKNKENVLKLMSKHAQILRPKFDTVLGKLQEYFKDNHILKWDEPKGGYFISVYTLEGTAKKVVSMCRNLGVFLTDAGSTYPKGFDEKDSNIRIALSSPSIDELEIAIDIFCLCVEISSIDKILSTKYSYIY